MKKYFLLAIIILLAGSTVGMETEFTQIDRDASIDSPAVFQVDIYNNGSDTQRYRLNHEFSKSGWLYYDSYKTVSPGETENFKITVTPSKDALQNSYNLNLFLTEETTGLSESFSSIVNVKKENVLNVKGIEYGDTEVEPGEKVKASITVQNLNSRIVDGYLVGSRFGGDSRQIEGEPMAPKALKSYEFEYQVPKNSSPGDKTLETWVKHNQNFQNSSKIFSITEVKNITRRSSEIDRGLYVSGSIRFVNNGNSNTTVTGEKSFPNYAEPLLSLSHEPSSISTNDSATTYTWEASLSPGESVEFSYGINYWAPLVLAIIIILGLVVLRKITGNIKISKTVDRDEDEIKVSLEILNSSSTSKDVICVEDFVPNVVKLHEDFEMAKPEIKEKSDGLVLSWSLEDFNAGEKRVITYRVKEKLNVEDGVDLPPAKIVEGDKVVSKSD